jgi:aldehyde dehydrogenase (NAD+)
MFEQGRQYDPHIDGEDWTDDDETRPIVDPGTGETIGTVTMSAPETVERAIAVGADRQDEWASLDPSERGRALTDAADLVEAEKEGLVRAEVIESGKPRGEASFDVDATAGFLRYYGGLADKVEGSEIPVPGDRLSFTTREPLGVTGHVVPWNSPMLLAARSFGPALACGNAVVAKPDVKTPITCLWLARLLEAAGVPPGVVNVVPGSGTTAKALTNSAAIDSITFTGSVTTGRRVLESCAQNITPAVVELGSKSPVVLMDDGDVAGAAGSVIDSGYLNAGQQCFAGSRAVVHEAVHEEFVDELVARVEDLTVGYGDDPETDMGPLVSEGQYESVREYIELGREEATLRTGGETVTEGVPDGGRYIEPTVFDDVTPDSRIAREEIFGPVVSVLTFSDYEEMIDIANGTEYGLSAGVWTDSVRTAHRAIDDIDAGVISVNEYPATWAQTPFGGFKKSGIGREKGQQAIEHYTQVKNATINVE